MSYQELFNIIDDNSAKADELDDAIIYLADYPNEEVVNYLLKIGSRNLEDYMLSSIGESIGHIFKKDKLLYTKFYNETLNLPDLVQSEIDAVLR